MKHPKLVPSLHGNGSVGVAPGADRVAAVRLQVVESKCDTSHTDRPHQDRCHGAVDPASPKDRNAFVARQQMRNVFAANSVHWKERAGDVARVANAPHHAFSGQTPDEVYFDQADGVRERLIAARRQARFENGGEARSVMRGVRTTLYSAIRECFQHRRKCAAVTPEGSRTQQGYAPGPCLKMWIWKD